ncbi:hypothetical protein [Halapricum hydrolyticum]|uniref:Uncharacterized protein n=1 Tax=Halapricum hydrolyticum TaxID=2979991 RepID=A0AAE3IB16_9EURY|nr:hypothetical protein [Halapricum hydrolyticum]MCU4716552.1 hypothetical protein [Halapricum hydrolyticum]MCU4725843.1 hypothetical protein [Halapricum hydrolyticum]
MSYAPRLECPACGTAIPADRARGQVRVECPGCRRERTLDQFVEVSIDA